MRQVAPIARRRRVRLSNPLPRPGDAHSVIPQVYESDLSAEDTPTFSYDYGMAEFAEQVTDKWYSHLRDDEPQVWPADYVARIPADNKKDRSKCLLIAYRLLWALASQYIGVLKPLEYRMMCFIVNRTWTWHKPREGISLRQFRDGVFDTTTGECLQSGIGNSDAGLIRARNRLRTVLLLHWGYARTTHINTTICWYEVNVMHLLGGADDLRQSAQHRTFVATTTSEEGL
jgi:hypothetical protein